MTINPAIFSSKKDDWETPQYYFDSLNKRFQFTVDAASSESNHKLPRYWTAEDSGLVKPWAGERVFPNPPYGRQMVEWMRKCYTEWSSGQCQIIVALVPARTDTRWFHNFVYKKADLEFLRGRLRFEVCGISKDAAPFPSMICIYRGENADI